MVISIAAPALATASVAALQLAGRAAARIMEMELLEQGAGAAAGNSVDIGLETAAEVAVGTSVGQTLTFARGGVTVTFYQNLDGEARIRATGEAGAEELRAVAEEVARRLAQQYAYHRLVTEMKARGMSIVDEEVERDGTVRMQVRVYRG